MRVAKPNSTSNSPRGSAGLGRRRTVMADGAYRRRLAMMDQNVAAGGTIQNDGLQVPAYPTRPVSWHPSSHLAPQPVYQGAFQVPTPEINQLQMYDLPPTPAIYSGYTSPSSTFSPLSLPYSGYEQQMSYPHNSNSYQTNNNFNIDQTPYLQQPAQNFVSQSTSIVDSSMYSHFDWNNFAVNGFESSSTAPPTPENFLAIQHPDPTFPAEESIPYHPLSDSDDGEELIGMGLYDTPEPAKTLSSDPQLDNYRSLMMSHLLGVARRVEPTGKGLKLEETWNPPPSDDEEEEEEEDDEQDGEGESDDEDTTEQSTSIPIKTNEPANAVQTQSYDHSGWL
jgi:hypothetical protein